MRGTSGSRARCAGRTRVDERSQQLLKGGRMGFKLETGLSRLDVFFKEWQIRVLGYLWIVCRAAQ